MIDSHPLICINLPLVLIIKIKGIPANVIKLIKDRPPRERDQLVSSRHKLIILMDLCSLDNKITSVIVNNFAV